MWPFKKPGLNGDLIFLVAYRNSDYEMDISKEFVKTLTRKQIRMLNETCDLSREGFYCDTELLRGQEKRVEKDRIKAAADSKRKDKFEEKDHNLNGGPYEHDSEYAQYVKNNADKAFLNEDEEKRLMEMFGKIQEKIADTQEKLKTEPYTRFQKEAIDAAAGFFLNSAKNDKK